MYISQQNGLQILQYIGYVGHGNYFKPQDFLGHQSAWGGEVGLAQAGGGYLHHVGGDQVLQAELNWIVASFHQQS